MKKIITLQLVFALTVLNVNANVQITGFYPDMGLNTIQMGPYGEAFILEFPVTLKFDFSNTEPVILKLQIYVKATDFVKNLLNPSAKAKARASVVEENTATIDRKLKARQTSEAST